MNDLFLKPEQYRELDELMTYILGEMLETKDKVFIREGIIAYANRWHEMQVNAAEQSTSNCNLADVSINEGSESCEGVSVCELCGTSMMTTEDGHLKCMNLNCNGFEFTH